MTISATAFGKLVKRAFPGIKSNKKGPRGHSVQHYTGLKMINQKKQCNQITSMYTTAVHPPSSIEAKRSFPAEETPKYCDSFVSAELRSPPQACYENQTLQLHQQSSNHQNCLPANLEGVPGSSFFPCCSDCDQSSPGRISPGDSLHSGWAHFIISPSFLNRQHCPTMEDSHQLYQNYPFCNQLQGLQQDHHRFSLFHADVWLSFRWPLLIVFLSKKK